MLYRLYPMRALLILIALFAVPALACDFSFSTASITNGVMAKEVQGNTFEPIGITDTFAPDQNIFHAVVTIKNAPNDTAVKAVWTAVDVGSASAPNTKIAETELKANGSGNLDFTLKPSGDRLPPGSYKVEILLNGKLDRTLNFSITAPTPTPVPTRPLATATPTPVPPRPSAFVKSVTMATEVKADTKDPVAPTSEFRPSATFHAVVALQGAPANTKFKAMWFVTDIGSAAAPNTLIDQTEITADGTRNIDFTLQPTATWPPGKYRVEILVNNVLDRVVNFTVAGTAVPVATPTLASQASGIIKSITLATDSKPDTKEPINPTTEFKTNATFHAIVAIQNAPANTKIKSVWYATDVGSVAAPNTLIDQTELVADGTRNVDFTLQPSAAWPLGKFRVEIFVNGTLYSTVNFTVK